MTRGLVSSQWGETGAGLVVVQVVELEEVRLGVEEEEEVKLVVEVMEEVGVVVEVRMGCWWRLGRRWRS
jgi:hypothetical protein